MRLGRPKPLYIRFAPKPDIKPVEYTSRRSAQQEPDRLSCTGCGKSEKGASATSRPRESGDP